MCDDVICGGPGNDKLFGGAGFDVCYPGPGDSPGEGQCEPILIFQ